MKKISILAGLMLAPLMSLAATYSYINKTGSWQNVQASNATEALALSSANDINHGGVIANDGSMALATPTLYGGTVVFGNGTATVNTTTSSNTVSTGLHTYQYVDIYGNTQTVMADNATDAMNMATNISPNSGVVFVN